MTGLFGSLNTSTSGLRAHQSALQTTSHNLANANTEGYARQRVKMSTSIPQSVAGVGQIGTGVQISEITRVSDEYVTRQLNNGLSSLTQYEKKSDILGQLEVLFNEPSDTGLAHQMSEFFVSWSNLASNPELKTAKSMVIRQSETFLDTMNHLANQMDLLASETAREISKEALDFNSAAKQLKEINNQIFNATVKRERPNDLFDEQERLLAKMSEIADVDITTDRYGRAFVSLGGETIINENQLNELTVNEDSTISVNEKDIEITRGSIKGLQDALVVVEDKLADLNTFATDLATSVNGIMTDGEAGVPFFEFDPEDAAQTLSVNKALIDDPESLVTGESFENSISGDGSRAKAVADLQNNSLLYNQYNEIVTDMGIIKQQSDNMVANQSDLVALLDQRRQSISGVDINEEVVDMIRFQSAFQANARVISTISEMLDTLINRTGV